MRLICPNCDAQYEVPIEVIPAEGRDVQCSNCGQTWFQHHPDHMPVAAPDIAPAPVEEDVVETAPETSPAPREIDPAVADILREEAEAETRARAAEGLESQPELGLDDGLTPNETPAAPDPDTAHDAGEPPENEDKRAKQARDRMARLRGEEPEAEAGLDAGAGVAIGSRRDLLPDIEEINSTLRSTTDRRGSTPADNTAAPVAQTRKRSFRRGFALSVMIFALAIMLYAMTPRIIEEMPQAEPTLTAYTTQVDAARLWLDGQVTRFLQWLDSMAA